jgi:hypothetical protein
LLEPSGAKISQTDPGSAAMESILGDSMAAAAAAFTLKTAMNASGIGI